MYLCLRAKPEAISSGIPQYFQLSANKVATVQTSEKVNELIKQLFSQEACNSANILATKLPFNNTPCGMYIYEAAYVRSVLGSNFKPIKYLPLGLA